MNNMENYRHKVMYYETDMMGLTHHSNYIRFMEEARVDFLEKGGWPYQKLESMGIFSPVIEVNCRFKTPTTFSDVIEIEVGVEEYGGARLRVKYRMKNSRGETVCEGFSEHCFTDRSGRPIRLRNVCPEFDRWLREMANGACER